MQHGYFFSSLTWIFSFYGWIYVHLWFFEESGIRICRQHWDDSSWLYWEEDKYQTLHFRARGSSRFHFLTSLLLYLVSVFLSCLLSKIARFPFGGHKVLIAKVGFDMFFAFHFKSSFPLAVRRNYLQERHTCTGGNRWRGCWCGWQFHGPTTVCNYGLRHLQTLESNWG